MFTKEYLEKYVVYDSELGFLYRKATGHKLNCKNHKGYIFFKVGKYKSIMAARAAWIIHHNEEIPDGFIVDHINGVRDDNRIVNLRVIESGLNNHNTKQRIDRKNINYGGLMDRKGKFLVQFQHNHKKMSFGTYSSDLEASIVYVCVKRRYCEFYNGNDLADDHPVKIIGIENAMSLLDGIKTTKGIPARMVLFKRGIL